MADVKIVKTEIHDTDMMEKLLNDNSISQELKARLLEYKKFIKHHTNEVEVVYHDAKGLDATELGRSYVHYNKGLQSFPKIVRNPLIQKYYFDIDMENAHYNLMVKMGKDWRVPTENIEYYCNNRDACLKMISDDRNEAKTQFLKVAYGGNIDLDVRVIGKVDESDEKTEVVEIPKAVDVVDENKKRGFELMERIKIEVDTMMDVCYGKYENLHKYLKKNTNRKASLFSIVLQTEERKCLIAIDEFLRNNGRRADILMFDGLNVRKCPDEQKFPEDLLRKAEIHVFNTTGHKIKLAEKPIEHNFVETIENVKLTNDINATRKLVSLLGNNVTKYGKTVYYFDVDTGMWSPDETVCRSWIMKFESQLVFKHGKNKITDYGGNQRNISLMMKGISTVVKSSNFLKDRENSSIGKLLFADGIYNFDTNTFTKGFDLNIVFYKRISRNFPTERNELLIAQINHILFVDAFDVDGHREAGEYLKRALCNALYGNFLGKNFTL
jgi:hypothetical protein